MSEERIRQLETALTDLKKVSESARRMCFIHAGTEEEFKVHNDLQTVLLSLRTFKFGDTN